MFILDPDPYQLTVLIFATVILSFISYLRYTLSCLSISKLKQFESDKNAKKLISMISSPISITATMKSWHHTVLLICGIIAGLSFIDNLRLGIFPLKSVIEIIALIIIINITDVIFWHIVPGRADKSALKMIKIYSFIHFISYPFLKILNLILKPILPKESELKEARKVTETDLLMLVEEASKQGVLEEEEKDMIASVFELSNTTAREIMIPRMDIIAVEKNTPVSKAIDLAMEHGLSRMPIYEETIDKVIGIIHTKDLIIPLRNQKTDMPIKKIMRKPLFIPENKKTDEILKDMQSAKMAMAIVVDEYGGTDGLLTMEDCIEEIVGEIADEYDKDIEPIVKNEDGSFTVSGKTQIYEVNEFLNLSISDEEFETISGYLCGLAGHIPTEGDQLEDDFMSVIIEKVIGHRISSMKIILKPKNNEIAE